MDIYLLHPFGNPVVLLRTYVNNHYVLILQFYVKVYVTSGE